MIKVKRMENVWYKAGEDIKHFISEEIVKIKDDDFRKNCEVVFTYMRDIATRLGDTDVEHDVENVTPLSISFIDASSVKKSIVNKDRSLIKSSKTYFDGATLVHLSLVTCAVSIDASITSDKDYENVEGKICISFNMTDVNFSDEDMIMFDKYMADSLLEFDNLKPLIDLAVQAIVVAKVRFPNNIDGTKYDYMDIDPWKLDFDYPCSYGGDGIYDNDKFAPLWDFETEVEQETAPELEHTDGDFGAIMGIDIEKCNEPVKDIWEQSVDEKKRQKERIKIMLERLEKFSNTGTFT